MQKIYYFIFFGVFSLVQMAGASGGNSQTVSGDPMRGKALFDSDLGCNVCHGPEATGAVGPNIREITTIEMVYHALQNFPDMMNWQYNNPELFEEQALLDIVAYLQTLAREPVIAIEWPYSELLSTINIKFIISCKVKFISQ